MKQKLYELLKNRFGVADILLDGTHDDDALTGKFSAFPDWT